MAEPTTDAKTDAPLAPPKLALDSTKPLSSQVNTITKLMDQKAAEAPAKEEPKTDEKPAGEPDVPDAPSSPAEEPDDEPQPAAKPVELGTVEKYILDKLPTLTTRIKAGDEVKTVRFKDISDLPANFELADDAARAQFTADVAAQVGRAKDALTEYRQIDLANQVRKYEEQEAKEVASDLARLQRQKLIPPFKYKEDDPQFNTDDAVKLANRIYKLFKDTNEDYRKAGKTYRITFADAADKHFAREARKAANESQIAKDQPKDEKREPTAAQKERQQIAKQTGAPSGGEPAPMRPRAQPGMRFDDINRLVRLGRI